LTIKYIQTPKEAEFDGLLGLSSYLCSLFLYFLKKQKTIEQLHVENAADTRIAIGPNLDQTV